MNNPFDEYHEEYEQWFSENEMVYNSELKAVQHLVLENKKGLEIGVGTGRFAAPLGIATGVEPAASMGKLAEQKGIDVYYDKGEDLPFSDNSFDLVLIVTTLCFLDDVDQTFKEIRRVLKEEGHLIIGFIDRDSPLGKQYEKNKKENVFYQSAEFHSAGETLKLLNKYDFKDIEIIQTIFGKIGDINQVQDFKTGHGEGGFVVIKGRLEN